MREKIKKLVTSITPYDQLEEEHKLNVLGWIDSGAELFRIQKPDVPPKHLVSYFILFDQSTKKLLLVDHIKAGLWLPAGGHVEKDENPTGTVKREIQEELSIAAEFIVETPIFVTVTKTINTSSPHTDVSLWYLLKGDSTKKLDYDTREFNGYKWVSSEEILAMDIKTLDPHLHRLVKKLTAII